jgi:hypothetical protein
MYIFSSTSRSPTGLIQSPIQWKTETFFPVKKRSGREVNELSQSSAEVMNKWMYISTTSMRLHGVDRGNFTFPNPYKDMQMSF